MGCAPRTHLAVPIANASGQCAMISSSTQNPCAVQTDPQLAVQRTGDVIEYYNAAFIPVAKTLLIRVGAGKQPLKSPPGENRDALLFLLPRNGSVRNGDQRATSKCIRSKSVDSKDIGFTTNSTCSSTIIVRKPTGGQTLAFRGESP